MTELASKKISDLPSLNTQSTTDIYEVSKNGTGSYKETRAQMLAYMQANVAAQQYVVWVSNKGSAGGKGTLTQPFDTRSTALAFIGSAATLENPYVIAYDAGSYTEATFPIYPNIFDYVPADNSVNMTVTSGTVVLHSSWASQVANYAMHGIIFDVATTLNLNFSSLSAVVANLFFTKNVFMSLGSNSINSLNSNINPMFENNIFSGGLTLTSPTDLEASNGNSFNSVDIESGVTSAEIKANFSNNKALGSITLHTQSGANMTAYFRNSPTTDFTLHAENKSSIVAHADSSSWQDPTILGGDASLTRLTQAEAINVQHTPVNYTQNPPGNPSIEAAIAGIDDALGSMGGNTVSFNAGQTIAQTIPNAPPLPVVVQFNSPQFDKGGYYDATNFWHKPEVAGVYCYFGQLQFQTPTVDARCIVYLIKNSSVGTYVAYSGIVEIPAGTVDPVNIPILFNNVEMNGTTDYIQIAVAVFGNGGSPLTLIGYPYITYFGGYLCNQKASPVTPATLLRGIWVSPNGSDADGDGTESFPFRNIQFAQQYITTHFSPTINNPYPVIMDAGAYDETGLKVYPNIPWVTRGPINISNDTDIVLDSSWSGQTVDTAAFSVQGDITINSGTVFNMDSTGISGFGGSISLQGVSTVEDTSFINTNGSGDFTLSFLGNCKLATGSGKNVLFDSIPTFTSVNGNRFAINSGSVTVNTTYGNTSLQVRSQLSDGFWNFVSSTGTIFAEIFAGSPITVENSYGTSNISLTFDSSTFNGRGGGTFNNTIAAIVAYNGLNKIYVDSQFGDDIFNSGGPDFPFQTIKAANDYAAGFVTPGNYIDLMIAPGTYNETDFYTRPNINYIGSGSDSTNVSVGNSAIALKNTWTGAMGTSKIKGITFDPSTSISMDFSSFTSTTATIYFEDVVCAGLSNAVIGSNNTVSVVHNDCELSDGVTYTNVQPITIEKGNFIGAIDANYLVTNGAFTVDIHDNVFVGAVTVHAKNNVLASLSVTGSPSSSYTLHTEDTSIIGAEIDSPSWSAITETGSNITVTLSTQPRSINGLQATSSNHPLMSVANANPAYATATYPTTTTINRILYSSANDTVDEITTANNAVLITSALGVPSFSSTLPTLGGLTVLGATTINSSGSSAINIGTGTYSGTMTFGNASATIKFANDITPSTTTGGQYLGNASRPWGFLYLGSATNYVPINVTTQSVNGTQLNIPDLGTGGSQTMVVNTDNNQTSTSATMVANNTYFANNASLVTLTLPSTLSQGQKFRIVGMGTGGWKVAQASGQTIHWNSTSATTTGTGGSLQSTDQYDCVDLIVISSTDLNVYNAKGNITVT